MFFFFLMIRRPPRSTLDRSSAASDVYKRQKQRPDVFDLVLPDVQQAGAQRRAQPLVQAHAEEAVSYTHLRAHETVLDLVCRLLLEKKKTQTVTAHSINQSTQPQTYTRDSQYMTC